MMFSNLVKPLKSCNSCNHVHVMHVKGLVLESTVDYVVQIIIIGAYSFSMTVMACMLKGFKTRSL